MDRSAVPGGPRARVGLPNDLHATRRMKGSAGRALAAALFSMALLAAAGARAEGNDNYSDTWEAVDGLGRELPVGDLRELRDDRFVGIFYFIWHQRTKEPEVYDISRITAGRAQPWSDAPWGPPAAFHWWGEPRLGYYDINDEFVLAKHAQLLADAGVDVVLFDVTNGFTYDATYRTLCRVYRSLRAEGRRTPQLAFVANRSSDEVVSRLYEDFYSKGSCSGLWFRWQGKPLVLASRGDLPEPIASFFTFRRSWAWTDPEGWFGDGRDRWPWLDDFPQRHGWHADPSIPEQIVVGAAQHPTRNYGRSYHGGRQPALDASYRTRHTARGLGFQEQWDRALEVEPPFVLVTQWNEWIAQRFVRCGEHDSRVPAFLGRPLACGDTHFIDEFNQEYSRDLEPMRGGHGDAYYYQLVANVRRYKGARRAPVAAPARSIDIAAGQAPWDTITPVYLDDRGDVAHRDFSAFAGPTVYRDSSGRNDIVSARVAYDATALFFRVETTKSLTAPAGDSYMLLFLDADRDASTGWLGFDYVVGREQRPDSVSLEAHVGPGFAWAPAGSVRVAREHAALVLEVPRARVALDHHPLDFRFKWADNLPSVPEPLDFIDRGDVAPNGRFTYRFRTALPEDRRGRLPLSAKVLPDAEEAPGRGPSCSQGAVRPARVVEHGWLLGLALASACRRRRRDRARS